MKTTEKLIEGKLKNLQTRGCFNSPEEVDEYFKDALNEIAQQAKLEERERIVKILEVIEGEGFPDEVHCSCLPFAIDYLRKGASYEENHERIETLSNPNKNV